MNTTVRVPMMTVVLSIALCMMTLLIVGCEEEGPLERTGKRIDESISDTTDAVEDAADDLEEQAEDLE